MSIATGNWEAKIDSPVGKQVINLVLVEQDGVLTGSAVAEGADLPFTPGVVEGDSATFAVDVSKPFAMTLSFAVTIDGDSFAGTAKPGKFPGQKVTGVRLS